MDSRPFADEEWSVILDEMAGSEAAMSFVSEEAPFQSLRKGDRFQLFEGRWPVAEGQIL